MAGSYFLSSHVTWGKNQTWLGKTHEYLKKYLRKFWLSVNMTDIAVRGHEKVCWNFHGFDKTPQAKATGQQRAESVLQLSGYALSVSRVRAGTQARQTPEAGTGAEAMVELCFLAFLLLMACLALPIHLSTMYPGRWHHPQGSASPYISHQSRECPTRWPTSQSGGGIFIHSSQMALACVDPKLTRTEGLFFEWSQEQSTLLSSLRAVLLPLLVEPLLATPRCFPL